MRVQLKWLVKPALMTTLTVVLFGCAAGGAQQFQAGQSAYTSGNLEEAYRQYEAAASADPSNPQYKTAQSKVGTELAKKSAGEAAAFEKGGQWSYAADAWGKAAKYAPDQVDYAVRRDLSAARAKDPDQSDWFKATKAIADANPGNQVAEEAFSDARDKAYQYHVGLAEDLLAAGRGAEALKNIESARTIDPDTPGLRADVVAKAEALSLSQEGDKLSESGQHIAAYEKYQAAYAKLALPEIKAKRDQSKVKAGKILALLEQARSQNKRGRYAQAVALYERALKLGGVPDSIKDEVAGARQSLVQKDAEAATKYASRGALRSAERSIVLGLRHAKADKKVTTDIKAGVSAARKGRPAETLAKLENSGLSTDSPLYDATYAVALASAKQVYARARRYSKSKRTKAKALGLLSDLEPFEEDLPQVAELRRSLRSGSFLDLIADAKLAAKKKRDGEAASLLMAALNASPSGATIKAPMTKGTDALKVGRFAEAEKAFSEALVKAPRSKLAQAATDLTRNRRAQAEQEAVSLLRSGKGNDLEATELLEAGLALDPGNKNARAGVLALTTRLKQPGLSDRQAGALIGYANRLGATPEVAKADVAAGAQRLAEGDTAGASEAFAKAIDAAPGAQLAKTGKKMADARAVASLKGEAAAATTGDAAAAEALGALLKKNPRDPDARRQLQALLDKAKSLSANQNDAEAARFLGLATVALSPEPKLKAALDKGHAALKVGNIPAAERAYGEARQIDANNPAARTGYEIAKGARLSALSGALQAAKSGGDTKPVVAQIEASFSVDPKSPEARKAVQALLDEAKRQGEAGNTARAAVLLDAAAAGEPAATRTAVTGANGLLKAGKFSEASAVYAKVLSKGASATASAGQSLANRGASTNLTTAVKGLETGADLTRGASAAKALLKKDPNNSAARAAVRAGLMRAEKASADGDDASAARNLRAVSVALGTEAAMKPGIDLLAKGKYAEAEEAFNKKPGSEVSRAGSRIARTRKLFALKAGLSGSGASAALSIRRLLQANPNDPEAQKAFNALLTKAERAAEAGDDATAAATLDEASVAAGSPRPLENAIRAATAQLKEGRYAQAELNFGAARDINADSKVVKTGLSIARSSRARFEASALKAFGTSADPRPIATKLANSRLVDPKSPAIAKGVQVLIKRAEKSASAGKDTDVAQSLEAAVTLENKSGEQVQAVTEGAAQLTQGAYADARRTFNLTNEGVERGDTSAVAQAGAKLATQRQLATLKNRYAAAQKSKDILKQADLVQQILEVNPSRPHGPARQGQAGGFGAEGAIDGGEEPKGSGQAGRGPPILGALVALNGKDKAAQAELKDVEKKLKDSSTLIMVVEQIQRNTRLGTGPCGGFDGILRAELQTTISKKGDLGAYVLSPAWTELYEKKDSRARQ